MNIQLSDHFTYRRLMRFVLPTVVMMIISSIYSIVDGFFVSTIVGKTAFAAVNLIMPLIMAIGAFGFMIGTGGSALVAKTLGEGKTQEASRYFSMMIKCIVIFGVCISILTFTFMRPLAYLLGATEAIVEDCVIYGRILIISNTFFMLQNSFQSFLVTAEKPKMGLLISIISGITNVVLDFLLIYVFRMGVLGAAVATAISQFMGGMIPVIYFSKKNPSRLKLYNTKLDLRILGKACVNGSSEMLTNLSTSFVSMLYNFQLLRIAQENGVAAYGVIMYVNFIFMAFFFGHAIGVSPITGYHYGAKNTNELKNIFKKSMILTLIVAVVMTVLGIVLAHPLAHLFVGYDVALARMTTWGMTLYSLSFLVCGFNIFGSAFFTALNNGALSALISVLRTLVFQVAAVLILPMIFGINGIWLAIFTAEAITLFVTAGLLVKNRTRYQYM